ncbi:MAG: hypothetical protein E6J40_07775 [Chloroflexi bacterium]|nr:MAG: hypothetical protein E6J40_07775 [Chloroflexota bacterium]
MGTVTNILLRARNLASAGLMAISFAVWAPLSVFACSTTGGSASATGTGGGGLSNPFGPIDAQAATNAVVAGFVLTLGLAALSIWVAVVIMRRRRPQAILVDRLSPDGRYWWDGAFWRPVPPG